MNRDENVIRRPHQHKNVIERREQFLRKNSLSVQTIMNQSQKEAFLAEVKAEYHGSAEQLRRQQLDIDLCKSVMAGKKQRWSRECQRRGGTTSMFHLLSFFGRCILMAEAPIRVMQRLWRTGGPQHMASSRDMLAASYTSSFALAFFSRQTLRYQIRQYLRKTVRGM